MGLGASMLAGAYLVLRGLLAVTGVTAFGSAGLVALILFLAGVQLLAIGALGEYMARVFEEAARRPLYLVKEHTDGEDRVIPPPRFE
jgi:hypothetical protein